jgi:hypothetical protein
MDSMVRKCTSLKEMKADEYRYWQSRPVHERMLAVSELSLAAYAMKGTIPDVSNVRRKIVCLQRRKRED